jgi:DNA polymerase
MDSLQRKRRLERIAERIRSFRGIPIARSSRNAVPGEGNPDAKIVLVGQAPGKVEDETGRPFQGRAGRFLDEMLRIAGLRRNEVFITSVLKWFPPKNRAPNRAEIAASLPFLLEQLDVIQPKLIVLLGGVACKSLVGDVDLRMMHGRTIAKGGRRYFITFHPAAGMRFPSIRACMRSDFAKLAKIVKRL